MTILKLDRITPDFTRQNIWRLAELFPECVTEGPADTDRPVIDFDLLRQVLTDHLVEGPQERYRLDWPGKREALLFANVATDKTIRPLRESSVDFDTTRHLFIEGDNLDALKLLQETYLGRVKVIYIDPPYNTGKDFIYKDNFNQSREEYEAGSGLRDEEGGRLVTNPETNGRFHSDWLSMMYPRLKLARNLLSDDGVIFASLDQGEDKAFRFLADEIFGEDNFISSISVKVNPRGRHLDRYIAAVHEQLIVYAKDASAGRSLRGMERPDAMIEEFDQEDDRGRYRLLGLRNRNQAFNPQTRPKLYFPLYASPEDGSVSLESEGREGPILPHASDGTPTCWTWSREKVAAEASLLVATRLGDEWRVSRKSYLNDDQGEASRTLPKSIWDEAGFSNDRGRSAVKELFGKALMDFPKSPDLIGRVLEVAAGRDDIIMDFFAGSGTTAHAVLAANARRGTSLRYITVQLDEATPEASDAFEAGFATISQLARERIRRAGEQLISDAPVLAGQLDVGFRTFRIDSGNFHDTRVAPDQATQGMLDGLISHIKDDRSDEDLLFGALLRWGVDITLPVKQAELLGRTIWIVDPPPEGEAGAALVACFARPAGGKAGLDTELADALSAMNAAIASGVEGTFLSVSTLPSSPTTQIAVSSSETSSPT